MCLSEIGPFATLQVDKALPKDALEILEFMLDDFLTNEPLNVAIGLSREDSRDFFLEMVKCSMQDGLSYLVRDPANGGRLAAVRLACILRRQNGENGEELFNGESEGGARATTGRMGQVQAILHAVEAKIWQFVPSDCNKLITWMIISVHGNYKRKGIAKALLEHKLDEAVALGCQGAITEATAINSQMLFQKLGYIRLFELMHSEWKDEDGKQIFRCPDGTDRVTLEFKSFNSLINGLSGY